LTVNPADNPGVPFAGLVLGLEYEATLPPPA
jgi:hypothetical protein